MIKKRTAAIGTLIIAGAGYVAGILTAPKSGRETRKDIRKAAQKAKTEAERKLKRAYSELDNVLEQARNLASKSKGKVNSDVEKAQAQAQKAHQKARELLSAVHEGEADDKDLQKAIDEVKKAGANLKKFLTKSS